MMWINSLQDVLTVLDQYLPWLLPSMESIESAFPVQARLLVCLSLILCLALKRRRFDTDSGMRLAPGG